MGLLIVIAIIVFVGLQVIWTEGKKQSNDTITPPFDIRVSKRKELFDKVQIAVFEVEMSGTIINLGDNKISNLILNVFDVTDSAKIPILCAIEELQISDSPMLGFKTEIPLPYTASALKDWVLVVKIPIDSLCFPRKGSRDIVFNLKIEGTSAEATFGITHLVNEIGYLEKKENRDKYEVLTVQLAFSVSSTDGEVHKNEAKVISDWMHKQVALHNNDEKTKERLNSTIINELQRFNENRRRDTGVLCRELLSVSSIAKRYDALELCIHVAKADGIAENAELVLLERLAVLLKIDKDKFRLMRDKHLTLSMMGTSDEIDVDKILGIHSGMTAADIKKHLRQEFQKWNQIATHKDADKRQQAKEMLELIGKKRSELGNV